MFARAHLLGFCFLTTACGGSSQAPAHAPAEAPSTEPPPVAAPAATMTREQSRPLELVNNCQTPVEIAYGPDPRKPDSTNTVGAGLTVSAPRQTDGSQIVWLRDDQKTPLIKVIVTKRMKRIEVGRSCLTLDAR